MVSIAMMGCIYVFVQVGGYPGMISIAALLLLLVVFLRLNNKA